MSERKGKEHKGRGPNIPKLFVCPITLEIMKEPTITNCGHMFEKEAIIGWIKGRDNLKNEDIPCPMCNQPITESQLAPCFPVKNAIEEFLSTGKFFGEEKKSNHGNATGSVSSARKNFARVKDGVSKLFRKSNAKTDEGTSTTSTAITTMTSYSNRSEQTLPQTKWARLESLNRSYESIDITKDNFIIGRSLSLCDYTINRGEISSKHVTFYRVPKLGANGQFDCFIQDLSTNGTYVNGKRQQKEAPTYVKYGDEISLGTRFTTQEKPEVGSFVDWIFLGTLKSSSIYPEIEKAKTIPVFDDLIEMNEEDLTNYGIQSQDVKSKLMAAIQGWRNDHQLPIYRFVIFDTSTRNSYYPSSNHILSSHTTNSNSTPDRVSTNLILDEIQPSSPLNMQEIRHDASSLLYSDEFLSNLEPVQLEYGFSPKSYTAEASLRQVVLTIKRNINIGESYVFISSTEDGTARSGRDFNPVKEDAIFFPDRADSVSYLFKWGLGTDGLEGGWGGGDNAIQTINFVLVHPNGSHAAGFEDSSSSAIVNIVGSGVPQDIPRISIDEDPSDMLLQKMTHLFVDVSPATISGVIQREKRASTQSYEQLEENIVKKVLWYRDLPSEKDNLPPEVSYDQSSFKYQRKNEESKSQDSGSTSQDSGSTSQDSVSTSQDSVSTSQDNGSQDSAVTSQHSGVKPHSSEAKLTIKVGKNRFNPVLPPPPISTSPIQLIAPPINLPPPPPSIAGWSSFSKVGTLDIFDIPNFILITSLDYILNTTNYREFLNQNYIPHSTHRPSLLISTCKEIKNALMVDFKKSKDKNKFNQSEVLERVTESTDLIMSQLMSGGDMDREDIPKLESGYECSQSPVTVNMSTRSLIIEDFAGMYQIPDAEIQSLYLIIDGFGGKKSSEIVSMQIPAYLSTFTNTDTKTAISKAFISTSDYITRKNEQEKQKYGAILSMFYLKGSIGYFAWIGASQSYMYSAVKETSITDNNLILEPSVLSKKNPGSIECIGVTSDDEAIEEWLANSEVTFEDSKHVATPHIIQMTFTGNEYFIVMGSKNFWKVLDQNNVGNLLSKYCLQINNISPTDFLITQARRQDPKNTEDISVLVFKFTNFYT